MRLRSSRRTQGRIQVEVIDATVSERGAAFPNICVLLYEYKCRFHPIQTVRVFRYQRMNGLVVEAYIA